MRKTLLVCLLPLLLMFAGGCATEEIPRLEISAGILDFGWDGKEETFQVFNKGEGTLEWELEITEDWVGVSSVSGKDDKVITVTIDREGLEPGSYSAEIQVKSEIGQESVLVKAEVKDPEELKPGEIKRFRVEGVTAPEEIGVEVNKVYVEMMEERDRKGIGVHNIQPFDFEPYPMPEGFAGGFVLSWEKVESLAGIEGFRVEKWDEDRARFVKDREVGIEEIEVQEIEGDFYHIYHYFDQEYLVHEGKEFRIIAFNEYGSSAPSASDTGFILEPVTKVSPAKGSTIVVNKPVFVWQEIESGEYYKPTVTGPVVWETIVDGNSARIDGELPQGDYEWFTVSYGEQMDFSVSQIWSFTVEE